MFGNVVCLKRLAKLLYCNSFVTNLVSCGAKTRQLASVRYANKVTTIPNESRDTHTHRLQMLIPAI